MIVHFFAFILICLAIEKQAVAQQQYYCYEVIRDRNRPLGANDCAPPLVYQPTVQLCCAQQPVQGATLQQTYAQIPQPGSPEAIPERCERGLHFPSGLTRCRTGLVLRTVGRNQLCCQPDVQLPDSLTGNHAPVGVVGQPGLITGLRTICAPNQQRITSSNGIVCMDPQTVWDPQRMCCAYTLAAQQPLTGAGAVSSACVDLTVPGRASDCPARRELCDNALYRDLMTQQCPQTCNRCGARAALGAQFANANLAANACVDNVGPNGRSDCADRVAYCRIPMYRTLMMQECPFTCNLCNALGTNRAPRVGSVRIFPAGGLNPGGIINIPPGLQIPTPAPTLPPINNVSPVA
uniref:ShKT domain-containing protein n=1 Tax=Globodera rostochiensis TaxID=31243 RepID=A0A914H458_GLORO